MYYQDNNTEHDKVNYPAYSQTMPDSLEKVECKINKNISSPCSY